MSKRNEYAREKVYETIKEAFGTNFVTVQDKKIYVNAADDTGEMIQFAITITQPKNPIGGSQENNWTTEEKSTETSSNTNTASNAVETSAAEEAKVKELMESLGLN